MICRFILVGLLTIFSYFLYGQKNYYRPKYFVILDSINGESLIDQCSRDRPDSVTEFWTVTEFDEKIFLSDFKKIEALTSNKSGAIGRGPKLWKNYCFQIVGFKNGTRKYIYLNVFNIISEKENFKSGIWKKKPVIACGGGDWYWGAVYDIERRSFVELDINVLH